MNQIQFSLKFTCKLMVLFLLSFQVKAVGHDASAVGRLASVAAKILSLEIEKKKETDFLFLSQRSYLMEFEIVKLIQDVAVDVKLSADQKTFWIAKAIGLYKKLREVQEFLFEDSVKLIDRLFPGTGGVQLKLSSKGVIYFDPNFRLDVRIPKNTAAVIYAKKLYAARLRGFKPEQIVNLDEKILHALRGFHVLEFVETEEGVVKATSGDAGHLILAQGKRVKTAGQIAVFVNDQARIELAVVSNASGNYKSDISSTYEFGRRLGREFGIPPEKLVVTKGAIFSPQSYKLYLRGTGASDGHVYAKMTSLVKKGRELLGRHESSCFGIFKSLISK